MKLLQKANSRIAQGASDLPGRLKAWGWVQGLSTEDAEVYNYISAFGDTSLLSRAGKSTSSARLEGEALRDTETDEMQKYFASCGLSDAFTNSVTNEFYDIIASPEKSVELFEGLVSSLRLYKALTH